MSERAPFAERWLIAAAPQIAEQLLIAARAVLRREHLAWIARREAERAAATAPPPPPLPPKRKR